MRPQPVTSKETLACIQTLATLGPFIHDSEKTSIQAIIQFKTYGMPDITVDNKFTGILRLSPGQELPTLVGGYGTFLIFASFCQVPVVEGPWCHYQPDQYQFFGDLHWFYDLDMADVDVDDPPIIHISGKPSGFDHESQIIKFRASPYISTISDVETTLPPRPSTLLICNCESNCSSQFDTVYAQLATADNVTVVGTLFKQNIHPHKNTLVGFTVSIHDIAITEAVMEFGTFGTTL